jgi:putative heme iron utilization protein
MFIGHPEDLGQEGNVESTLEIINELSKDEAIMWVVGGGSVVSENNSKGIKEPEVSGGFVTVEADNWHFHLGVDQVTGIQFVEAESHGDSLSFYVRFSDNKEETLLRGYFPNPYLDNDSQRTEFQPEKLRAFEEMRDRYVGREGIVFVKRPRQPAAPAEG